MKFLKKIAGVFHCLLYEDCEYSIKKLLVYIFTLLVIYVVIFTDKSYYDLLLFIAVLVGVRAYEKNNDMILGRKRVVNPKPTEKDVLVD